MTEIELKFQVPDASRSAVQRAVATKGAHVTRLQAVYFDTPSPLLQPGKFRQRVLKQGVKLSRKTSMLYAGKHLFINGESFAIGRADRKALLLLANERSLSGEDVAASSEDVQEALYTWYEDGWVLPR